LLTLVFDIDALKDLDETLRDKVEAEAKKAMEVLSQQTMTKVQELAQSELHSTREKYLENLSYFQAAENTWVINLDEKALWIEEGMEPHSMLDQLLASPKAKIGKKGRYITVPFDQSKRTSSQTSYQTDLTQAIKKELKSQKLPGLGVIEKGVDGKPKLGTLHRLNVPTPLKTHEGPGQGRGAIGQPRQGVTGIPHLQGVRISQHKLPGGRVVKTAMTFRTASESQRGKGVWEHPGTDEKLLLDKAFAWAQQELNGTIIPQILQAVQDGWSRG